jgi:glutathione S-transferase
MVIRMIRRKVRGNLHGQGLGRFSPEERKTLLQLDIASLSTLLADKPYMLGAAPCWLDATVFAFLASALLATLGDTPAGSWSASIPIWWTMWRACASSTFRNGRCSDDWRDSCKPC